MTDGRPALTAADRRWTVLLWVLALVLPVGAVVQPWLFPSRSALPPVPRRVHLPLLLVTVPGLRADRVHHLGDDTASTPTLDELLWEGVSFTDAYAASNDALATAAALMTGKTPAQLGVLGAGDVLPPRERTLAQRLADFDYHTVALVNDPDLAAAGLERGFERFVTLAPDADAQAVLDEALAAIRSAPTPSWFVWADLPDLRDAENENAYAAALTDLDAALGRFLAQLEQDMLLELITVVVTGTRGAPLDGRPGLYEPCIHVPLLMRFAAQRIRGLQLQRFAGSIDVAPTLLDALLRQDLPELCGRSLRTDIMARYQTNRFAYSEGRHGPGPDAPRAWTAISTVQGGGVKIIQPLAPDAPAQLYDLQRDPGERRDIAPAEGAFVDRIRETLAGWRADCDLQDG